MTSAFFSWRDEPVSVECRREWTLATSWCAYRSTVPVPLTATRACPNARTAARHRTPEPGGDTELRIGRATRLVTAITDRIGPRPDNERLVLNRAFRNSAG